MFTAPFAIVNTVSELQTLDLQLQLQDVQVTTH